MFGYINSVNSELKIKDFYILKSYYCGLCMTIKDKYGNLPRIGLNYDTTFFAILFDSINIEESKTFQTKCIKHPQTKQTCILKNKALDYAADLNIALLYYKSLDDVLDKNNFKNRSLSKILLTYYKKLTHKNINKIIEPNLKKLHTYELEGNFNNLDEISHPFSHIIGQILKEIPFKLTKDTPKVRETLYKFGYSLGKWIYLIDAIDDLKNDMAEDSFNPINKIYNSSNFCYSNLIIDIKEYMDFVLMTLALNCSDLLNDLPIIRNQAIIDNIINLGLIDKYSTISESL